MATQSKAVSWLTGKATSVGELCLAGLTLPTAVWAGEHFTFSGPSAVVSFVSTEGCITTDVSVFASDESLHDPPGPPTPMSVANVMIDQFDNCTGATLLSAFGEATLTDQAFEVKSQLTSATLNATVQVTDSITGSTSNVDVDLTWSSIGDLFQQTLHTHVHTPGLISQSRSNGAFREAQASGSVSLGGVNLATQPSNFAEILSAKGGASDN
jgi:hypothetical protein